MDSKIKFFDETFKVLFVFNVCTWLIYFAFILFVGGGESCEATSSSWFLTTLAWLAGTLTAPPLIYGVARLLFWPGGGPKHSLDFVAIWILIVGSGIFIAASILFALAVAQYGCQ
jgi:hypothetical protein